MPPPQSLQNGQTLIIFPEGTRTQPGQAPAFHRGAAAIALRGAKILTPVIIKVSPTTLTKAEPWYRIPSRRVHFSFRVGADIDPQTFAAQGPAPQASRKLNDYLHSYFIKELAEDERSEHSSLMHDIKLLIIDALGLEDISVDDIGDEQTLFGEGLGLDSVDALELGLAIQKKYGIKIDADAKDTRNHFTNVASLAAFVTAKQAA